MQNYFLLDFPQRSALRGIRMLADKARSLTNAGGLRQKVNSFTQASQEAWRNPMPVILQIPSSLLCSHLTDLYAHLKLSQT